MDINSVQNSYPSNLLFNNSTFTVPKINNVDTSLTQKDSISTSTEKTIPTVGLNSNTPITTAKYNPIEDGTSKADISSILTNSPSLLYKAVDILGASQTQNLGNFINLLV